MSDEDKANYLLSVVIALRSMAKAGILDNAAVLRVTESALKNVVTESALKNVGLASFTTPG